MSEELDVLESELDSLKARAAQLGIKHHPAIGIDKLREKVNAALTGEPEASESPEVPEVPSAEVITTDDGRKIKAKPETEAQLKLRLKKEATKLVRVRVTCMNPNKSEWEGEIISAGNSIIGQVKKYVPYGGQPYHIPQVLLNVLEERMYQTFYTVVDRRTGNKTRKGKLVREFAIEKLDPLTEEEKAAIATRQLADKALA